MVRSTTQQGDIFEKKVFDLIRPLIMDGKMEIKLLNKEGSSFMWTIPQDSEIIPKDKDLYPWGRVVVNDISIRSGQDLKILVECKGYKKTHAVDQGEIAEFNTRIMDLKAQKGIFITSSHFQEGAFKMAEYHNIALARVDDYDVIHWDLQRMSGISPKTDAEVFEYLCYEKSRSLSAVYDFDSRKLYYSFSDYICDYLGITPHSFENKIPYLSDEEIEKLSASFLCNRGYSNVPDYILSFYLILNHISLEFGLLNDRCLGVFDVLDNKITIAQSLINDEHRQRFTIAHEVGHSILHRNYLRKIVQQVSDEDVAIFFNNEKWFSRMEIQANIFASCLLMPKRSFIGTALAIFDKQGRCMNKPFYVDNQKCNLHDFSILLTTLSSFFKVSKEAVRYRLQNLNLLNDCREETGPLMFDVNSIV